MRRIDLLVCVFSLLAIAPASANDGSFVSGRGSGSGLIAPAHDPNCPGCRAFLAGYTTGGGPSCNCAHAPSCAVGEPGTAPSASPGDGMGPGDNLLASDYGSGYGYEASAPGMIGDFFGGGYQMLIQSAGQGQPTNLSIAGADRRFKIAENYSPFPTNRVFFNYNHFHNALLTADGRQANYNRGTFGVESTFFDQMMSLEFRFPFGSGLNGDQIVDPTANNVSGEIGNIAFALKGLLLQRETVSVSAGLGIVLPTGPDTNLFGAGNQGLVMTMENEAYYLQPFLGLWYNPDDQFFAQFAAQLDFDAHGNPVNFVQAGGPQDGVIQDQTLLFLDASFGYWLFHYPNSGGLITGVAPMIELHYNTTLEDPDIVDSSDVDPVGSFVTGVITNFRGRLDVLNLTGALRLELAGTSYLTFFGVAPLRSGDDQLFDVEFGVQYSRFY